MNLEKSTPSSWIRLTLKQINTILQKSPLKEGLSLLVWILNAIAKPSKGSCDFWDPATAALLYLTWKRFHSFVWGDYVKFGPSGEHLSVFFSFMLGDFHSPDLKPYYIKGFLLAWFVILFWKSGVWGENPKESETASWSLMCFTCSKRSCYCFFCFVLHPSEHSKSLQNRPSDIFLGLANYSQATYRQPHNS